MRNLPPLYDFLFSVPNHRFIRTKSPCPSLWFRVITVISKDTVVPGQIQIDLPVGVFSIEMIDNDHIFVLIAPSVSENGWMVFCKRDDIAVCHNIQLFPDTNQFLIISKDRVILSHLLFGIDLYIIRIHRNPRLCIPGRESCIRTCIPLHWRPAVVPGMNLQNPIGIGLC